MTKTIKTQIQFIYEWKQREEIYGSGISDVADFQHHSRYEEPQLNKIKMFNRSTSAAILLISC